MFRKKGCCLEKLSAANQDTALCVQIKLRLPQCPYLKANMLWFKSVHKELKRYFPKKIAGTLVTCGSHVATKTAEM